MLFGPFELAGTILFWEARVLLAPQRTRVRVSSSAWQQLLPGTRWALSLLCFRARLSNATETQHWHTERAILSDCQAAHERYEATAGRMKSATILVGFADCILFKQFFLSVHVGGEGERLILLSSLYNFSNHFCKC